MGMIVDDSLGIMGQRSNGKSYKSADRMENDDKVDGKKYSFIVIRSRFVFWSVLHFIRYFYDFSILSNCCQSR